MLKPSHDDQESAITRAFNRLLHRITVLRPKELGLMQKFGLKPKETAKYGNRPK